MDGQAELAPISTDELAQFLIDNPESDGADETEDTNEPTDAAPSNEDTEAPETEDDSPDDPDDESEEKPDPTSGRPQDSRPLPRHATTVGACPSASKSPSPCRTTRRPGTSSVHGTTRWSPALPT